MTETAARTDGRVVHGLIGTGVSGTFSGPHYEFVQDDLPPPGEDLYRRDNFHDEDDRR